MESQPIVRVGSRRNERPKRNRHRRHPGPRNQMRSARAPPVVKVVYTRLGKCSIRRGERDVGRDRGERDAAHRPDPRDTADRPATCTVSARCKASLTYWRRREEREPVARSCRQQSHCVDQQRAKVGSNALLCALYKPMASSKPWQSTKTAFCAMRSSPRSASESALAATALAPAAGATAGGAEKGRKAVRSQLG